MEPTSQLKSKSKTLYIVIGILCLVIFAGLICWQYQKPERKSDANEQNQSPNQNNSSESSQPNSNSPVPNSSDAADGSPASNNSIASPSDNQQPPNVSNFGTDNRSSTDQSSTYQNVQGGNFDR